MRHLRAQMLIAMGLPACWTGPTPAPQPPPTPAPRVERDFDATSCKRDSLAETICGRRRETVRSCGATAENLDAVEHYDLHVTDEEEQPATAYRDFVFDRDQTRRFRGDREGSERSRACCYSRCTELTVGAPEPTVPGARHFGSKCMPAPPNGTSRPAKEDPACPEGVLIDGTIRPYASSDEGQCCYAVPMRVRTYSIPGRPLRVDGIPQVAAVTPRADWTLALDPVLPHDAAVRARLAEAWLRIAQLEHASIASFGALAVRLLAAGAPLALVERAHEAALDEVRHAQLAFALASAYAGTALGPGAFEAAGRAELRGGLRELALETFVDGCINETVAAHQAELAAASARDPVVAGVLAGIAEDEARHGALAWAIVAWAVREGAVSAAELSEMGTVPISAAANDDLLVHGIVEGALAAQARTQVLDEVVAPCLAALAAA